MPELLSPENAVELIQLALAPVFLIVGIGQLLNAATGRLARIIDRVRWYDRQQREHPDFLNEDGARELNFLGRRMRFVNWAITFWTAAVVMICLDIILLIFNGLLAYDLEAIILLLFTLSVSLMTGGIFAFFIEVSLASAMLKVSLTRCTSRS